MTAPTSATDTAREVAGRLTKAQRAKVLESEPGAWNRTEDATGAGLVGAGGYATGRALVRAGLGIIEEHPGMWPSALFFNNSAGLAVRAILQDGDHMHGSALPADTDTAGLSGEYGVGAAPSEDSASSPDGAVGGVSPSDLELLRDLATDFRLSWQKKAAVSHALSALTAFSTSELTDGGKALALVRAMAGNSSMGVPFTEDAVIHFNSDHYVCAREIIAALTQPVAVTSGMPDRGEEA